MQEADKFTSKVNLGVRDVFEFGEAQDKSLPGPNNCKIALSSILRFTLAVDAPDLHTNHHAPKKHRQAHNPCRDFPRVRTLVLVHGLACLTEGLHAGLGGGELGDEMSEGCTAHGRLMLS